MSKRTIPPTQKDDEIIMTLPVEALESLGAPVGSYMQGGHDAGMGNTYMGVSPTGRDEPFPCFKKSSWDSQVTIKIVQSPAMNGTT